MLDQASNEQRGASHQYKMREKLISIGDDFWIENERGERVYRVDGKALRLQEKLIFEDAQGQPLLKIKHKVMTIKDTTEIEDASGQTVAVVKQALLTLRARFKVDVTGGADLDVEGNLINHEYEIRAGHEKVAQVSKKLLHVRDSYGIAIEPGQNDILLIAVAVCIDQMAH
jgi:uncharacterized protein YxjI